MLVPLTLMLMSPCAGLWLCCRCAAVVPESIGNLTALTGLGLMHNQISGELVRREACVEG